MRPHTLHPFPQHTHSHPSAADGRHLPRPRSPVLPCLPPATISSGLRGHRVPAGPRVPTGFGTQSSWPCITLMVSPLAGDRHIFSTPDSRLWGCTAPHSTAALWGQRVTLPRDPGDCPQQAPAVSSHSFLCASHWLPLPGRTPPQRNLAIILKIRPRTAGGWQRSSLRRGTLPGADEREHHSGCCLPRAPRSRSGHGPVLLPGTSPGTAGLRAGWAGGFLIPGGCFFPSHWCPSGTASGWRGACAPQCQILGTGHGSAVPPLPEVPWGCWGPQSRLLLLGSPPWFLLPLTGAVAQDGSPGGFGVVPGLSQL